jgi:hypothetical protein
MTLQLFRPNLLVVADHSVGGMSLGVLAPLFPGLGRSAHYVIIENGVIDAWQGRNINTVIGEYYAIIQKVRDESRIPVLTGFSRQSRGGELNSFQVQLRDSYDAILQSIATNTTFADWGQVPFFGAWDLRNPIHVAWQVADGGRAPFGDRGHCRPGARSGNASNSEGLHVAQVIARVQQHLAGVRRDRDSPGDQRPSSSGRRAWARRTWLSAWA